jgi:hypothetical protein
MITSGDVGIDQTKGVEPVFWPGKIIGMPTNVTPEYKKAEEAYRKAREPGERLDCLRELLRTIPKHKGTVHLQADLKTRIKQIRGQ